VREGSSREDRRGDDRLARLHKLVAVLADGDVVFIPAVDSLSRDTTDQLVTAREMQGNGADNRSRAEAFLDTKCNIVEIVSDIFGVRANLERSRIVECIARGRSDHTAESVKSGRKPKLTQHQQPEASERLAMGEPQRSFVRSYCLNRSTVSRIDHLSLQGST
jgi:DNA invertase Pin-like site-specific DNA recombinase